MIFHLEYTKEKRVPAHLLLESPWFSTFQINSVKGATAVMRNFFEKNT